MGAGDMLRRDIDWGRNEAKPQGAGRHDKVAARGGPWSDGSLLVACDEYTHSWRTGIIWKTLRNERNPMNGMEQSVD